MMEDLGNVYLSNKIVLEPLHCFEVAKGWVCDDSIYDLSVYPSMN